MLLGDVDLAGVPHLADAALGGDDDLGVDLRGREFAALDGVEDEIDGAVPVATERAKEVAVDEGVGGRFLGVAWRLEGGQGICDRVVGVRLGAFWKLIGECLAQGVQCAGEIGGVDAPSAERVSQPDHLGREDIGPVGAKRRGEVCQHLLELTLPGGMRAGRVAGIHLLVRFEQVGRGKPGERAGARSHDLGGK